MGYLQIILLLVLSISVVRSELVDDAGDTVQDVVDTAQDMTSDSKGEELPGADPEIDNPNEETGEAPGLGSSKNTRQETVDTSSDSSSRANAYTTRCQMCKVKTTDSGARHMWDTNKEETVTGQCQEHECPAGMDWCLVTYYEHRADERSAYDEIRLYQCGTKALRDSRSICRELQDDKNNAGDYYKVQECQTKRSSGTTTSYSLLTIATLLVSKLLLLN